MRSLSARSSGTRSPSGYDFEGVLCQLIASTLAFSFASCMAGGLPHVTLGGSFLAVLDATSLLRSEILPNVR
ncbi:hypothetical protein BD310DRAFT_930416 [Dichomitus squalens]|uniref:Uncharacterized protein n=1 Tax=Dichomitus squalens TaxID=114155 RepID=A0A4Q9PRT6_9APHY|nr:hypothetical protein BD310DRAFT_930416 [Dichomitus squalens]